MIRISPSLVCSCFAIILACAEGSKVKPIQPDRPQNFKLDTVPAQSSPGDLVEATHMLSLSQTELNSKLAPILASLKLSAKNGVHIYKVKYQTLSPATPLAPAHAVLASGILMVPDSKQTSYPWISIQHGTITGKANAPSVSPSEGIFEASQGFLTLVMDYIGYGSSSLEFHPYLISQAYADAGVDMLKAAYQFSEINKIGHGPLFLKGYSEGGYATLALQKEIEQKHPEFPLLASAPSAGPYDMDAVALNLVGQKELNPVNISFVILSYNRWLANNDFNTNAIFNAPTADMQKLFDGALSSEAVYKLLPTATKSLLNPILVDDFLSNEAVTREGSKLHSFLKSQSLTNKDWQPAKTTLFSHCVDDEVVPVLSSELAATAFKAPHVILQKIPSPASGPAYQHGTCPAIFTPTLFFIDELKKLSAQ
ncbi:MAG: hypothetical protein NTX25_17075 [Proteobacteria bacterium]|nr:hypothetical protein [Pseudomonadota bacterium]